jgi:hypothetical protein
MLQGAVRRVLGCQIQVWTSLNRPREPGDSGSKLKKAVKAEMERQTEGQKCGIADRYSNSPPNHMDVHILALAFGACDYLMLTQGYH